MTIPRVLPFKAHTDSGVWQRVVFIRAAQFTREKQPVKSLPTTDIQHSQPWLDEPLTFPGMVNFPGDS
jgi:hypothetical protein